MPEMRRLLTVQREDVRFIVEYYRNIPDTLKYEWQERERIEDEYYNGLKSKGEDGMPHSASVGRPTERAGLIAAQDDAAGQLERSKIRIKTLEADRQIIKDCIEDMNGKYKRVIFWKLIYEYSWGKISVKFERPESTCRYWLDLALDRLGEILEKDVVMLPELVERASRAR